MKYLIVSDIHGSADSANHIERLYRELGCDYILCLGDVLYHGPRNDLPEAYAPKKVISVLNPLADKIICVKGNCEAEVDQMVLDFKILDSYDATLNGITCHLEHGHHLDEYKGKPMLIMSGHTHIPVLEMKDGILYLNPGSITIPKAGSARGYAVLDGKNVALYDLDRNKLKEYTF